MFLYNFFDWPAWQDTSKKDGQIIQADWIALLRARQDEWIRWLSIGCGMFPQCYHFFIYLL